MAYFTTIAVRMRYADYRDLGMFIGSGAVEAGCKAVIGQRLELSGMRWSAPGATGILTLRAQHASGPWEQVWHRTNNQTSTPTGRLQFLILVTYKPVPHPSCAPTADPPRVNRRGLRGRRSRPGRDFRPCHRRRARRCILTRLTR